jgi:putative ABC transport system substrate-binding protein
MRRREALTMLVGGLVAGPLAARAQQPVPVIGFLNGGSARPFAHFVVAFRDGLRKAGFVEGENVAVEYHWAESKYERLPALAAELVARRVAVIAATTTQAALAAKSATPTIPIVFTTAGNPVELGLVASLSRPGANVTGATQLSVDTASKRLELLHELLPAAKRLALLINPAAPSTPATTESTRVAARALGIVLHVIAAGREREIDDAFVNAAELGAAGIAIGSDVFFDIRSEQLARLALRHKLPTISQYREFTAAGGLVGYGGSIAASYHIAGVLTGRILKGEKPADLPVEQSTKIELVINLKTAQALGLNVPPLLLARADEVIE